VTAATVGRPAPPAAASPLRSRAFRLLAAGQLASSAGDQLYLIALPALMLARPGGTHGLGALLAVFGLCRAVALPAGGWLADRLGPRRVMLAADLLRAGALAGFTALAWTPGAHFWALAAVAGVLGLGEGCFNPAALAVMPSLIPRAALQSANAAYQAGMQTVGICAPALGGLVVAAFHPGGALLADTASFLLSAATLILIARNRPRPTASPQPADSLPSAHPATPRPSVVLLLRTDSLLRAFLLAAVAASLVIGGVLDVALPTLAAGPMGEGSTGYGLLVAGFGAGSLAGAVAASRIGRRGTGPVAVSSIAVLGFALAGIAAAGSWRGPGGLAAAFALTLVAGAGPALGNVLLLTLFQRRVPPAALGRVMALMLAANTGLFPVSTLLAGVCIGAFGVQAYLAVAGLFVSGCVLVTLTSGSVRHAGLATSGSGGA
jgi:MFS family permease